MKTVKPVLLTAAFIFTVVLIIPTLLVIPFMEGEAHQAETNNMKEESTLAATTNPTPALEVAVYRSGTQKIDNLPLEEYVAGVVASEMPASYEIEALKAQALSARTYIVKYLLSNDSLSAPKGANVTDTVMHQVFKSTEELKKLWGPDFEWKIKRINEAVEATKGQIITYNNEPITASFFSTSNGYTENSEDYWKNAYPYLRSVKSPWDKDSPKYLATQTFTIDDLQSKLGVKIDENENFVKIIERTEGMKVAKVQIGNKVLEGREVREKLGLNSTDFNIKKSGSDIVITTKGWGHGVGMSQFGAHGMAKEGKSYKDIIAYYYQGTEINTISPFVAKIAKK